MSLSLSTNIINALFDLSTNTFVQDTQRETTTNLIAPLYHGITAVILRLSILFTHYIIYKLTILFGIFKEKTKGEF